VVSRKRSRLTLRVEAGSEDRHKGVAKKGLESVRRVECTILRIVARTAS